MILDPEDYIARMACALALDDLAEAKRVMADMARHAGVVSEYRYEGYCESFDHVYLEAIQRGQSAARSRCPSPST